MTAELDSPDRPYLSSDLIRVLRDRAPRAALTLAAGQAVWPYLCPVRRMLREHRSYTVKVPCGGDGDRLYDELHEWILDLLPSRQRRALTAYSPRTRITPMPGRRDRLPQIPVQLKLRYDGSREQAVTVAGFRVKVSVTDRNGPAARDGLPPEIVFTVTSAAARDALLTEISSVLEASQRKRPSVRVLNQWDEWERVDDLPLRTLDSVILPPGQLTRVTEDVRAFLGAEAGYARRSVPWHRGYLFEGPPGTGKTSLARAVACHFGLDMWHLSLAGVKTDANLVRMILNVRSRSVLLLEDIDIFHAATRRDDEQDRTTLSGLLNALDGITTPHGLITILTTNNPGVLDPALIRPGRVDMTEHFALAGPDEIARLVSRWHDAPADVSMLPAGFRISPADVTEACKRSTAPADAITWLKEQYTVPISR